MNTHISITAISRPSALKAARGYSARGFDASLFDTRFGPRLALAKGGFPSRIPSRARLDVNNHTPCQSPGKGRPH